MSDEEMGEPYVKWVIKDNAYFVVLFSALQTQMYTLSLQLCMTEYVEVTMAEPVLLQERCSGTVLMSRVHIAFNFY